MARAVMVVTQLAQPYVASPALPLVDLASLPAVNAADGMTLAIDGRTSLLIYNPDVAAHTVTVHSSPDPTGRTEDVTAYSVAAGHFVFFADFPQLGWNSGGGGLVNVDFSSALLHYAAIQRAPGT